jgi:acetoin utilization protein AcuB
MSTKVVTVLMDTSIAAIADLFEEANFHHVLVMDQGMLMGVISDRDVLKTISPFIDTFSEQDRDIGTLKKHAHQIMTRNPRSITPSHSLQDAATMILDNNISCLPVIDGEDVVGIVTWKDILKSAVDKL